MMGKGYQKVLVIRLNLVLHRMSGKTIIQARSKEVPTRSKKGCVRFEGLEEVSLFDSKALIFQD